MKLWVVGDAMSPAHEATFVLYSLVCFADNSNNRPRLDNDPDTWHNDISLTLTARLQKEYCSLTLTSDLGQSHDAVSQAACAKYLHRFRRVFCTPPHAGGRTADITGPCSAVAPLVDKFCMIVITNICIYLSTHYATENKIYLCIR